MMPQKNYPSCFQYLLQTDIQWQKSPCSSRENFIFLTSPHCNWSKQLCEEAFQNSKIATLINTHFTPVIVDSHIDPEYAGIMEQSLRFFLRGQSPLPGCIFLNAEGIPYFGGGYHPPAPKYGMPSFLQFLHHAIAQKDNSSTHGIEQYLSRANHIPVGPESWCYTWEKRIDAAYEQAFDFHNHGFDFAPKFPNLFRLQTWQQLPHRKETVQQTLLQMCTKPIFDPILGCLYRMSEDALWDLPVSEAQLTENAIFVDLIRQIPSCLPICETILSSWTDIASREDGLYSNSFSRSLHTITDAAEISWNETHPYLPQLPSSTTFSSLPKYEGEIRLDSRAICLSNAHWLQTMHRFAAQTQSSTWLQRADALEEAIWLHFHEQGQWFHTAEKQVLATGKDLALLLSVLQEIQKQYPSQTRAQRIISLNEYWQHQYLHEGYCLEHPTQRYWIRGHDLVGSRIPSSQEYAAYTLSTQQDVSIAKQHIKNQHWLLQRNPKILSLAFLAYQKIQRQPVIQTVVSTPAIRFQLHNPLSHWLLHVTRNQPITRITVDPISERFLRQRDHQNVLLFPTITWDWYTKFPHQGEMFADDASIVFGDIETTSPTTSHKTNAVVYQNNIMLLSPHMRISKTGEIIPSPTWIQSLCTHEDAAWWITDNTLFSTHSQHGHRLPTPLRNPIAIHIVHNDLLIAESQGLWIFHIDQERFARYAGGPGDSKKDGPCQQAVFQNITAITILNHHVFVADAHWIRIVDTREHTVHTLSFGCTPIHISALAFQKSTLYIADDVDHRLWIYDLADEHLQYHEATDIQDLCIHDDQLWLLQQGTLRTL